MKKKKEDKINTIDLIPDVIENIPAEREMYNDFEEFSDEANLRRAIPYVLFGSKPVVAHALWSMYVGKRYFNKPYSKSASISGETLKFSPHGDPYEALVRLTQSFVHHVPFVDGKGSFGSVIGGPDYAASRYTEMRLSEFSHDVLFYNTKLLDMGMNYLDEDPEPKIENWVALLPILFITNTKGVGYPVSNTWSSGNLYEFRDQLVNYLKTGKVDCSKIYPDFPTGGILINKSEMQQLYETGKGTITLRGETEIDGDTIKIYSLPYQVFPEDFVNNVKDIAFNKDERKIKIETIEDLADRSDKHGLYIEIECKPGMANYTLELLYRNTGLQKKISDEHKAISPNGRPVLYTFFDYMKTFVDANIALVKKEAQFNLDEINGKLELINGLLNALDIIDEIIATIKKSKSMEDAKNAIVAMKKYKFTERQADYIVHTALGRLANLEKIKLQDEKKELEKQKAIYEDLLVNRKSQDKFFLKRFNALVDKYGWERKTKLEDIEVKDIRLTVDKSERAPRPQKEFIIVLTGTNSLKRIEPTKFRATSEDEKNIKVQGTQKIMLISNMGMMYKVPTNKIDLCLPAATGTDIKDLRPEIGKEKILGIYDADVTVPYMFFVTKNGYGKSMITGNALNVSKDIGTTVCGLKSDGDEIIAIKLLEEDEEIEIKTNQRTVREGIGITQGRGGSGRKIINLRRGEQILDVHSVKKQ